MSCKSSNGKEFGVLKNEGIWRYYLRETNGQLLNVNYVTVY
jgi:hypothetical protein